MNTTPTRFFFALAFTATLAVAFGGRAHAAPGDLDTSFSGDGMLIQPIGSFSGEAKSVLVQDDAKIVVVGRHEAGGDAIAVVRYHPDGSLDTSFAGDGIQTTSIGPSHDTPYAAALQDDGKIIVAGETDNGGNYDFAVVRYNTDGSLDTSFSGDGIQTTDFAPIDFGVGVAIQSDGKIVMAGGSGTSISTFDFAVARFNTDGSLDTTFSGDGKLTTTFGLPVEMAAGVAIQGDGRIVVVGMASTAFAIARYDTDGTLDTSFSGDGKVLTSIGASAFASAVRIQSDGKIVASGSDSSDFAVARYNTDGSLDSGFSGDGIVTIGISSGTDRADALGIQGNGRIVLGGTADDEFAVARLEADGSLDTSFSGDGVETTTVGVLNSGAWSLAIQADGRIVTAGSAYDDGTHYRVAVVRYRGDECGDGLLELGEDCDDGNALAGDCCSAACDDVAPVDTPCGSSSDTICDNPDTCDAAGTCLPNHESEPIVCRGAAGECDVEEQCEAGDCPADDFVAADTACGDSSETICNKPDSCDGAGSCVSNLEPGSTPCRSAVDACDATEHCAAGDCPADGFAAVATACGDPGISVCDNADSCDGSGTCLPNHEPTSTACDADTNECTDDRCDGSGACAHPFNSAPCDDGLLCTSEDTCTGGVCVGGAPACDDADPCTQDKCDDIEGCYSVVEPRPVSSCLVAPKTSLKIQRDLDPSKNKLQWKWGSGEAFAHEDVGQPDVSDSYALCLYDTTESVTSLAMRIDIAPSPTSWTTKTLSGYQYKDKSRSSDGVQLVKVAAGEAGRTKASLKASGVNLPEITTPDEFVMFVQDPVLVAQLVSPGGICLTSSFEAADTKQNDIVRFQAKTKP